MKTKKNISPGQKDSRDMVLDKIDNSNNTLAASYILGRCQLEKRQKDSRDMVLDKIDNSNNTLAASYILGRCQLENCFDSLGRGLGAGTRQYKAQQLYLDLHDLAFLQVDLHPRGG